MDEPGVARSQRFGLKRNLATKLSNFYAFSIVIYEVSARG